MKKTILLFLMSAVFSFCHAQWSPLNSGTSLYLINVQFTSPNTGYIMASGGVLFKTLNAGTNWSVVNAGAYGGMIFFLNDSTGFVYSDTVVYRTTNSGTSFLPVLTGGQYEYYKAMHFPTSTTGYVARFNLMDSVLIYKTTDAGITWNYTGFISEFVVDPYSIFFTDVNTGYLGTNTGNIYKTTDGGVNWTLVFTTSSPDEINSIFFPSSQYGYAVTSNAQIIRTSDGGNNWVESAVAFSPLLYSIYCTSDNECHAVGGNGINTGTLIKTTDYGATWTQTGTSSQTFNSVFFINDSTGYTCGSNGTLLKYNASGSVGIIETNNEEITVYPNPVITHFTIKIPAEKTGSIQSIELVNAMGQVVESFPVAKPQYETDISSFPGGIYFVKIVTSSGVVKKTLVKL